MRLEFCCYLNDTCIKKIAIFTHKQKSYVEIVELRENSLGKAAFYPVHFEEHEKYDTAKAKFIGYTCEAAYENANSVNEARVDRENLFIRGSLPYSGGRGIKQA